MTTPQTNYRQQFFRHTNVDKITGRPTYHKLVQLYKQIKANASSVPSHLGGAQHGHLGLVLKPTKYALISLIPFTIPVHPGNGPTTRAGMSWEEMQANRLIYNDDKEAFDKVIAVQAALKQQINEAIDPEYLKDLQHAQSHTIENPINVIFETLFRKYGRITIKQRQQRYAEILQYNYNISTPIDQIFNMIDDYEELATHAGTPITPGQKIDMAYSIFLDTQKLDRALQKWNHKPIADRTWQNFKIHMEEAHREMEEFARPSAQEAGYAQANAIAERVIEQLQPQFSPPNQNPTLPTPATPDETQMLLLQSLNLLQEQVNNLQQNAAQPRNRRRNKRNNRNFPPSHAPAPQMSPTPFGPHPMNFTTGIVPPPGISSPPPGFNSPQGQTTQPPYIPPVPQPTFPPPYNSFYPPMPFTNGHNAQPMRQQQNNPQ